MGIESNNSAKKFKQTRELVRLALNDGWTQKEIAEKCRTYQSVVSDWLKGKTLGKESTLRPLLDLYGHKLRRKSFKLYRTEDEAGEVIFNKVEGKIVFQHTIFEEINTKEKKPVIKVTVHFQGEQNFCIVREVVFRKLKYQNSDTTEVCIPIRWNAWLQKVEGVSELIAVLENDFLNRVKEIEATTVRKDFGIVDYMLPYLIRVSLLQHGFNVDGIVEHPAKW